MRKDNRKHKRGIINGEETLERRRTYLGTEITALSLHLCLEIGQLSDRHIDVAAADVRSVPKVCGHADHAPVYPLVSLVRSAAAVVPSTSVPRRPRCQAAREALNPELAVAGHLTVIPRDDPLGRRVGTSQEERLGE